MAEKIIRSHRKRVKAANQTLKTNPRFSIQGISKISREAFVEFFLLEDIAKLYEFRLRDERAYIPQGRAGEKVKQLNIKKFMAVINVLNAAIETVRGAIAAGKYTMVRQAIKERKFKSAAKNVKHLPKLRELAINLLRDLSEDLYLALESDRGLDEDLDELERHEANVEKVKNLPPMSEIEEVIRVAEELIPNEKRSSKLTPNI